MAPDCLLAARSQQTRAQCLVTSHGHCLSNRAARCRLYCQRRRQHQDCSLGQTHPAAKLPGTQAVPTATKALSCYAAPPARGTWRRPPLPLPANWAYYRYLMLSKLGHLVASGLRLRQRRQREGLRQASVRQSHPGDFLRPLKAPPALAIRECLVQLMSQREVKLLRSAVRLQRWDQFLCFLLHVTIMIEVEVATRETLASELCRPMPALDFYWLKFADPHAYMRRLLHWGAWPEFKSSFHIPSWQRTR